MSDLLMLAALAGACAVIWLWVYRNIVPDKRLHTGDPFPKASLPQPPFKRPLRSPHQVASLPSHEHRCVRVPCCTVPVPPTCMPPPPRRERAGMMAAIEVPEDRSRCATCEAAAMDPNAGTKEAKQDE